MDGYISKRPFTVTVTLCMPDFDPPTPHVTLCNGEQLGLIISTLYQTLCALRSCDKNDTFKNVFVLFMVYVVLCPFLLN